MRVYLLLAFKSIRYFHFPQLNHNQILSRYIYFPQHCQQPLIIILIWSHISFKEIKEVLFNWHLIVNSGEILMIKASMKADPTPINFKLDRNFLFTKHFNATCTSKNLAIMCHLYCKMITDLDIKF